MRGSRNGFRVKAMRETDEQGRRARSEDQATNKADGQSDGAAYFTSGALAGQSSGAPMGGALPSAESVPMTVSRVPSTA